MAKILMLRSQKGIEFEPYNEDFRQFAIRNHGKQEYGEEPYSLHLSMVENVLVNSNYNDYKHRACAWLHDILEDTKATFQQVSYFYGVEIANMVHACSGEGENREERNASIYKKIGETPAAAPVKVADRIANMSYGLLTNSPKLKMYIREFPEFSKHLCPIMTETHRGALLWNRLEDTTALAYRRIGA